MLDHPLCVANSKAIINTYTSAEKTEQVPKLAVKAPKNVPK